MNGKSLMKHNRQKKKKNIFFLNFFPLSITTKYIQQLITMLLKIKLIKQDNAGHLFYFIFFNKQNKNKNTHNTQKKDKKRKRDETTRSRPPPFSF